MKNPGTGSALVYKALAEASGKTLQEVHDTAKLLTTFDSVSEVRFIALLNDVLETGCEDHGVSHRPFDYVDQLQDHEGELGLWHVKMCLDCSHYYEAVELAEEER